MKPYHYIIIVLLIIVIGLLIFARSTTNESSVIQACVNAGGSFNVATQTCENANPNTGGAQTSGSQTSSRTTTVTPKYTTGPAGYYSGAVPVMLPAYSNLTSSSTVLIVEQPGANTIVTSPLTVTGQARGTWFFEGVFPVILTDAHGRILAQGQARAANDAYTTDFVAFTATLTFPRQSYGSTGYLILRKDNESGLAKYDQAFERQVTFQ